MLCSRFIFLFLQHFFFPKRKKSYYVCYAIRLIPCCCPQVSTFIMMYRTHCQRILDTVIRANFDEASPFLFKMTTLKSVWAHSVFAACMFVISRRVQRPQVQSFLLHFWQGMPPHMLPVLGSPTVVNIVGVCDSILYKAISGVLMPTVLQALPDRWECPSTAAQSSQ